jgi:serine/threonine-protein kinase
VASRPDDHVTIGPDLAVTRTSTAPVDLRLHESHPHGAFAPGAIIAGRYRLVALLGRGGMGEVYRADDLTLDQPVALKFLPAGVAADPGRLAQFHNELRIARQVSHKNVCRLYDLGEAEGRRFLTMEYVDGEDLASLLRRIGRIPQDKAIDLARQLCAGLAAAHERGVLHRDLKPANVMIDGDGNVRLTDFGLAVVEGDTAASRAGTPQYMAPEQLRGEPPSVRSDLYALGLVLFELFTGRRVFDAKTFPELLRMHESATVTTPSSVVQDLDPAVERAILRCLERDAARRPATALVVAAALPGADPLAAALAAGETPSPELLIAAGESEAMPIGKALAAAAVAFAILAVFAVLSVRASRSAIAPLDKPADVLIDRIQQMTASFGYTDSPIDQAYGFTFPPDYPRWARDTSTTPQWWDELRRGSPPATVFWYRTSPRPMAPDRPVAAVSPTDPAPDVSGMRTVVTDTRGRLVEFHAVPPQQDTNTAPAPAPRWQQLFDAAGLDLRAFHPVAPEWTPHDFADVRQAWQGPLVDRPDITIRVEAAAYRGRPTSFSIVGPWTRASHMDALPQTLREKAAGMVGLLVWGVVILGGSLLARHHVRAKRADLRGATNLSLALFCGFAAGWMLGAHHSPDPGVETQRFVIAIAIILFQAAQVWVFYVAIEPYARRFWPDGLLGWSRLMSGRLRDSRVGRDVLTGAIAGGIILLIESARALIPPLFGARAQLPSFGDQLVTLGHPGAIPLGVIQIVYNALADALLLSLLFVFARLIVRHSWAALVIVILLITVTSNRGAFVTSGWLEAAFGLAITTTLMLTVFRGGLLTLSVALAVSNLLGSVPIAPSTSAWWATSGEIAIALVVALIAFGYAAARAGQPLFGRLDPSREAGL